MKAAPALLCAALSILMASCTSPIVKRIERNPDIYNSLSARHRDLVQQGRIEEGMTKKAVFLAWGKPDRAAQGSKNGRAYEKWSYAGYEPTYTTGFGFTGGYWGGGCGPWGYDRGFLYEPMMTYVPYEAAKVEFLNGIVTAWSRSR
jgi:hypothetical protein